MVRTDKVAFDLNAEADIGQCHCSSAVGLVFPSRVQVSRANKVRP